MRLGFGRLVSCLMTLSLGLACTQYKPNNYRNQIGRAPAAASEAANQSANKVTKPSGLMLANDKLTPLAATLSAKITLGGQTITQEFSPQGSTSIFNISGLPVTSNGILTVEIYQGTVLKFIAKKSQVSLAKPASDGIVVDDCNILVAPWDGKSNDSSCQWAITETSP